MAVSVHSETILVLEQTCVALFDTFWNRNVDSWNTQVRISWRRAVLLHVEDPGRSLVLCDAQRLCQLCRVPSSLELGVRYFILLTLEVNLAVTKHVWLCLVLEERVVQDVVVNIDLAHFWLDTLSHSLLQRFVRILTSGSDSIDSSVFNKLWQLEGSLVDAPLVLEIPSLLVPMSWDGH